jgi:hypothetical protein
MRALLRAHWPMALLTVAAAILLFTQLGRNYLWEDEGDTAVLARSILHHGVPVAWDGVTFSDPDYGQRLTSGFVMVSHPWLQYYAAAASFALFGETPWAARVPFAVAGLATIVVVYLMMIALVGNRRAAFSAAALLVLDVQFLLFSRQARNYSFNALFTCLLIWQFHRLTSWKQGAIFAGLAVVLFHAHPIGLAALAALAALTLTRRFASVRRWFWPAAIAVSIYVTPWLLLSRRGYGQNLKPLDGFREFIPRLLQFIVEWGSVAPIVGLIVLYLALHVRRSARRAGDRRGGGERRLTPEERSFVATCAAVAAAEAIVMAITHSRDDLWIEGLHQAPALIPIAMMLTGLFVMKISGSSRKTWVALMLVLGFTRLGQLGAWTAWAEPALTRQADQLVTFHVANTLPGRVLRTTQVHYVTSLGEDDNPGVIARISMFLGEHAAPGDVVVTNVEWEALYFHTGLPQGIKVASSFPIYPAARAANLPSYVFGPAGVRWIVWRRAWPAFFAEQNIEDVLRQIKEAGMAARLVATVPETLYENRENVHFHRFARGSYVYPVPHDLPDVQIYHVETFGEAIGFYRQALTSHPDDLHVLDDLGVALVAMGRVDEAVPVFQHAVDVAPRDARAQRNLANALFDRRDGAAAAEHARRAVALGPNDPAAHDVLGRALAVQGQLAPAIREFERALQIDPRYAEARQHLARARQLQRE